MLNELTIDTVRAAALRIHPYVLRTPLLERTLDGSTFFFKAENLQPTGAFKIRGAFSLMTTLREGAGVVAHSSGNHAQAVARAAKRLGQTSTIVMPHDAPVLKRKRTEADGATIVFVGSDSNERKEKADEIVQSQGLDLVPPYDHPLIAAGQGTAALEMLEQAPVGFDAFFCPVSGGGLLSGCATVFSECSPKTEIVGVEPSLANDVYLSIQRNQRVTIDPPKTIADGLRARSPGEKTWPVIQKHVHRIALVSEEEIERAMIWAFMELRTVVEPSGAVALAAALREGNGRVGVLLSGGNVDSNDFLQILGRWIQSNEVASSPNEP